MCTLRKQKNPKTPKQKTPKQQKATQDLSGSKMGK